MFFQLFDGNLLFSFLDDVEPHIDKTAKKGGVRSSNYSLSTANSYVQSSSEVR